jgi:hypothetical protein
VTGVVYTFGGRLMVGQGTLDPSVEVRVLAPEFPGSKIGHMADHMLRALTTLSYETPAQS